ncbi:MAG: hypothetical protein PW788_10575 [Micavibrio sp.]|nr:hypothetical protein [Micavibrio sp.]
MNEQFNAISGYMLRIDFRREDYSHGGVQKSDGYTRIFNFLAREVTTVTRDWVSEGRGSSAAGTSSVSSSSHIQSFDDLPSDLEIRHMHAKLLELGGKPPALEDILPNTIGKKPGRLRATGV